MHFCGSISKTVNAVTFWTQQNLHILDINALDMALILPHNNKQIKSICICVDNTTQHNTTIKHEQRCPKNKSTVTWTWSFSILFGFFCFWLYFYRFRCSLPSLVSISLILLAKKFQETKFKHLNWIFPRIFARINVRSNRRNITKRNMLH